MFSKEKVKVREIQAGFENEHLPLGRKPSNPLVQKYPGEEKQLETEDSPSAVLNPRSYFLTSLINL